MHASHFVHLWSKSEPATQILLIATILNPATGKGTAHSNRPEQQHLIKDADALKVTD